ncbi:hypothetical protein P43SY_000708 [Pythium insidiosum]|uniref:RNA helicase n=1 Tax=Pythium insidiosum TaxID=114742 RepID=A0AAD5M8V6_PYTIN|nr:hypothetical protein P43SY_000708 [Pythium insidiosum]
MPAAAHRLEILAAVESHSVVICVGETGSGKTTQIPQYLLAWLAAAGRRDELVAVTQPRRVATVSVAQRVAEELGTTVGGRGAVGYAIRFDDRTSAATRLKFVTDGVLVRECLSDPTLRRYAVVMLDEAHERSLHTDLLFGLLKQVLARRERDASLPPLKVLISSATLDAARVAAFFGGPAGVPVVRIPGRVHPVDIFHSKQLQVMGHRGPLSPYLRAAVETTLQVHHSEPEGHVLVFLTGHHEIEDACAQLRRLADEHAQSAGAGAGDRPTRLLVLPLYGALPAARQRAIFAPVGRDTRKVVVATNIAETSLTIDGVRFVVDCGFTKQKAYNPATRLESLVVVPISKVAAQQRAGRAGRTAPGKCFRLYSRESYDRVLLDETVPEIRRTNLANTVLYLKVLGLHDVLAFEWLDRPDDDALLDALHQLFVLDALDAAGTVTPIGRLMAEFPLDPTLARAMVEALALGCAADMARAVAMLSVESVFAPAPRANDDGGADADASGSRDDVMLRLTKADLVDDRGDPLTYLRILKAFEAQPSAHQRQWSQDLGLHVRALTTARSIAAQLDDVARSLECHADVRELQAEDERRAFRDRSRTTRLRRALCAGLFLNVAQRCALHTNVFRAMPEDDGDDDRYELKTASKGVQLLHLHPLSTLNYVRPPSCCVFLELVATSRPFMRHVLDVEASWVRACRRGGKTRVTTAQLLALSGRDDPEPTQAEQSKDPAATATAIETKTTDEDQGQEKKRTRSNADDAIAAARARFLARKRAR